MRIAGLTVARTTHWGCVSRRASLWQAWDLASQRLELAESNVGAAGQVWCQGRTYEERGPLCREGARGHIFDLRHSLRSSPCRMSRSVPRAVGGHHAHCWPDGRTDYTLGLCLAQGFPLAGVGSGVSTS